MGAGSWQGVQLVECINGEAGGAQDLAPLTVTGVELYAVTGRLQTGNLALRVQQFVSGVSGHAGLAHGHQDAGGMEYQPPAWAKEPGRFGDPAGRVAPQACTAFGDSQVETAGGERDVSGVSLEEREWEPEMFLAAAGGRELSTVFLKALGAEHVHGVDHDQNMLDLASATKLDGVEFFLIDYRDALVQAGFTVAAIDYPRPRDPAAWSTDEAAVPPFIVIKAIK
jgi:hypothetical protein